MCLMRLGCAPARRKIFRLIDNNRVQLFPRGLSELAAESVLVQRTAPETVMDPYLLMAYPFAGFFMCHRKTDLWQMRSSRV